MKNNDTVRVAIAETSLILRNGIALVLKNMQKMRIQPIEILTLESLEECVDSKCPDFVIVNPAFDGAFDVDAFRTKHKLKQVPVIALVSSFIDRSLLNKFDDYISILDDANAILEKLKRFNNREEEAIGHDNLSDREKEIVICVVRGLTNKEIASKLFLSIHTVITHRRNISKKLNIHSASGLTIYAIVNKLVSLDDIRS